MSGRSRVCWVGPSIALVLVPLPSEIESCATTAPVVVYSVYCIFMMMIHLPRSWHLTLWALVRAILLWISGLTLASLVLTTVRFYWRDNPRLHQYHQASLHLQTALQSSRARQSDWAEQYSELGRLQRQVATQLAEQWEQIRIPTTNTTGDASTTTGDASTTTPTGSPTHRLAQLLQVADLQSFRSSSSLTKSFSAALAEVRKFQSTVENAGTLEGLLMTTTTPEGAEQRVPIAICSTASLTTLLMPAARKQIQTLVWKDSNSRNPDALLEAKIIPWLAPLVTQRVAQEQEAAKSATTTTSNTTADCWTDVEAPLEWLETGLFALEGEPKRDIRPVLQKAMRASGLDPPPILDARLVPPRRRATPSPPLLLRDVLDTPTLHAWAPLLDTTLDAMTGYWPWLDGILETYVLVDADTDPVGPRLVRRVLKEWGGLELKVVVFVSQPEELLAMVKSMVWGVGTA